MLNENYIHSCHHYYHYNIIPFLGENILVSFGYFRYGYYHNREEYKHCCVFDIKNNNINEIDISNINYNNYNVRYLPIKIDDDKILFVFEDSVKLFKFNFDNVNLNNNQKEKIERNAPRLYGFYELFKNMIGNVNNKENKEMKLSEKTKKKRKERSRSRNRSRSKEQSKNKSKNFSQKKKSKNKVYYYIKY